jgi:hypothetical protein
LLHSRFAICIASKGVYKCWLEVLAAACSSGCCAVLMLCWHLKCVLLRQYKCVLLRHLARPGVNAAIDKDKSMWQQLAATAAGLAWKGGLSHLLRCLATFTARAVSVWQSDAGSGVACSIAELNWLNNSCTELQSLQCCCSSRLEALVPTAASASSPESSKLPMLLVGDNHTLCLPLRRSVLLLGIA